AAVAGIRFSGLLDNFDSETLRKSVADWGAFAPVIYMLIYTFAPVLFLPGLPITIVGGIIFGPVWGVVYSITGATAGASLAFLISRYFARDWIKAKLAGPRWKKLDKDVEKNGWKIVAFTRLVPFFPFNLLNYAFGLTSIKFISYAITSFICMLPACIAFIVFSSSLLDLLKGNVSAGLVVGITLICLVVLIPIVVKKHSNN
ncbi:MAG: TVP38/TMEM64 family protein, partial [Desulfamplus sp.]|nr:TVP38/TMEM64 family protein [Desulfamplus sp.]